ncbi:MAG: hypothetical protein JST19_06135 [Bacteroidetes bacterium]|nr:hypothetical protein [Bacteroidota bacterium]
MLRLPFRLLSFVFVVVAAFSSCQKDDSVGKPDALAQMQADSAQKLSLVSAPGNYLAGKGTLKVKLPDTTYTFDATRDSIAFVNINIDGEAYFGLTAINKAHTISFGISSPGSPIAETQSSVAGCQFLLHTPADKADQEFTLTRNVVSKDFGTITLDKYNQDTLLAKGTFHTYLTKKNSALVVADGTFELKMK